MPDGMLCSMYGGCEHAESPDQLRHTSLARLQPFLVTGIIFCRTTVARLSMYRGLMASFTPSRRGKPSHMRPSQRAPPAAPAGSFRLKQPEKLRRHRETGPQLLLTPVTVVRGRSRRR